MKILALEFYKNGEMKEAFALGGSLEKEKINPDKKYAARCRRNTHIIPLLRNNESVCWQLFISLVKFMHYESGEFIRSGPIKGASLFAVRYF